ncbi:histone-lysine N-methyltransferase SMYD3-like [Galleria mellonella]|uniref:Histone-lysine N-methyltransferase SMYD3-like n=1 Tax=Galleria mellonella TaxID=7137 RepID=A0ABM3MVC1_GALME|nr:histone-lysine N-methyltransferase SMYD3-like [Galleria mellonella]
MDSKFPKIVAKTDIKVGTVLALEKAFVVSPCPFDDAGSNYTTCSYCLKMSLNLFPCEGCTLALFCSKQCNELCLKEYHNTECHVAGFVKNRPDIQIPLRAAIKVRNMCKSWDELVALSNRYNKCFFPQSGDDKAKAIRAFARILIYLTIFSPPTYMILPESDTFDEITKFSKHPSFGLFPFIGKLKHSCIPNTRAAALNNTMALVALQPIKAGTELTITPVFHWLDCPQTKQDRQNRMLWFYRTVCSCVVCEASPHDWALMRQNSQLSVTQRRKHKMIFSNESPENFFEPNKTAGIYKKICECLELLNDVPFSKEYADMYRYFRKCLLYLQDYKSQNIVLDDSIDVYM